MILENRVGIYGRVRHFPTRPGLVPWYHILLSNRRICLMKISSVSINFFTLKSRGYPYPRHSYSTAREVLVPNTVVHRSRQLLLRLTEKAE